jgi:hypothetical protein
VPGAAIPLTAISPRKFLVLDALRQDRVGAETAHLVLLVIGEIALEPFDVAVALEGEDVGGDAVQEPAVVTDQHGAAGEILQRLLERTASDCKTFYFQLN